MFILQEIQTNAQGASALVTPVQRQTRPEIESVFYQTCAAAVISSVPIHTVIVYNEFGELLTDLCKFFLHET